METRNAEGAFQHAYWKHHLTTAALLELQTRIAEKLESGKKVGNYNIDISAAFDLLRSNIMMNILGKANISHDLIPYSTEKSTQILMEKSQKKRIWTWGVCRRQSSDLDFLQFMFVNLQLS